MVRLQGNMNRDSSCILEIASTYVTFHGPVSNCWHRPMCFQSLQFATLLVVVEIKRSYDTFIVLRLSRDNIKNVFKLSENWHILKRVNNMPATWSTVRRGNM